MEAKEERNDEDVSLTAADDAADADAADADADDAADTADDAEDADDDDGGDVALTTDAESNIIPQTPTKSSHTLAATHPNASAFAAAEMAGKLACDADASGGPDINAAISAGGMVPSLRRMAKAAEDIKRSLSRANSDLDTSERSIRVKFSVRCFTRVGMSLECTAD